jgi:hypothetical protein
MNGQKDRERARERETGRQTDMMKPIGAFRNFANVPKKGRLYREARGTVLPARRSQVRFPMGSLEFFINLILPAALQPWSQLSL